MSDTIVFTLDLFFIDLEFYSAIVYFTIWSKSLLLAIASERRFVPNIVLVDACGESIFGDNGSSGRWMALLVDYFRVSLLVCYGCGLNTLFGI